ncbi:MAG: recombinase family protein [Pseudomonadales bacterium]|mgnify:CR=1 FL=1|jgi:DNA invertase Pin-like site-specific DNA recombinase|nr:recombinase family protein [Pseudomonadales bacterium]MDP6472843.1 recombinase family protein [Pseudomonadales bacterium]MDP6826401.1 recombinase family protein [Pseudomonadales bacterium]MDP6972537.1 recombinase family protein [Pseudomonadales bacterium]
MKCAIYTRKSSEEGLDQDFNSLEAQREACEAYVKSQGWKTLKEHYDDGGYSGGTLDRPGVQRLLEHIDAGRIQVVVVYKIDRLTRSLADFAKLIEHFDAHEVSVVAVTQPFNTTTSMGRLTLNVLLSFAQFEREITGERIRDKIAASKQKGMWMGGIVPLGYDINDRQLIVNPDEAEVVRFIFTRYRDLGSVRLLKADLDNAGYVSKQRKNRRGCVTGGRPFSRGALYTLLRNPLYIGKVRQGDTLYEGQHKGIVQSNLFNTAQQKLDEGKTGYSTRGCSRSLLAGLLYDADGHRMTPSHTRRHNQRYRYYVSQQVLYGGKSTTLARVPAQEVEQAVIEALLALLSSPHKLINKLPDPSTKIIARLNTLIEKHTNLLQTGEYKNLRSLLARVELTDTALRITLNLDALFKPLGVTGTGSYVFEVSVRIKQCQHGKKLVVYGTNRANHLDPTLVSALTEAYRWHEMLKEPDVATFNDLAHKLDREHRYLARIHQLIYLAPDIQLGILEGTQPPDLILERLTKQTRIPLSFEEQRHLYGFPPAGQEAHP